MTKIAAHPRIPYFPYATSLQGARLLNLKEERVGNGTDLVFDYQELSVTTPVKIFMREEKLFNRVNGEVILRQLRFQGVRELQMSPVYKNLQETPSDHPAREIRDMLHWIPAGRKFTFYLLISSSQEQDRFHFFAHQAVQENASGYPEPFSIERDWSSPPPTHAGLVPQPRKLYERYGGDPVTIWVDARPFQHRLFIGSLGIQAERRPNVGCVLNLGEEPSAWAKSGNIPDSDRWENKGEGALGMSLEEIRFEAEWVIERLKAGERVLVHCVAGMNRSSTICCAVLILLEGMSAEKALERVREHHPWARPDSNHWLKLCWLAQRMESG